MAHVSDEEKARFRRQVESLREAELDEQPPVEVVKELRAAHGEPDTDDDPPELELYRRARALGMVRTSR